VRTPTVIHGSPKQNTNKTEREEMFPSLPL